MSSTTSAPAPQALTTPFVPPQSCINRFRTTSFVSSYYWNDYSTTTVTAVISEEASACQPSGWDPGQGIPLYSPAICPSGWTAYDLSGTVAISTAFCCSSGFSFSELHGALIPSIITKACFQDIVEETSTVTSTSTIQDRSYVTQPFPNGFRVHEAWNIMWGPGDQLSPHPPPLTDPCGQPLSSWVPSPLDPSYAACESAHSNIEEHGRASDSAGMWFVMVGLPILGFLSLVACCAVWYRRNKRVETQSQRPPEPTYDGFVLTEIGGK